MKNLTKIFMMVVAGMFAFSCVTDTTNDINPELGLGDVKGETSLTVSLEESRTHLGEKVGNLYKLLWSENDVITINGVASTGITIMEDNPSAAKFTFAEPGVTRPFCVVYSAPSAVVAEEGSEGETGESEPETPAATTVYPVTFLATQSWVNGTFCEGAAPMYGYGEAVAEGEDVPAIELQHLVGVLRIAPKGNVTLTKLDVVAQTGTIAGDYTVDCTNGALTPVANTSNKVTVDFGTGLELNAETETPIYVTVPAGSYGTFLVTLHTATDKMTVKFNSDVKPIAVGKVREFTPFTYEANELDSEGDYLIDSEDALVKFAKGASSFYPHTTAKVVADLNMSNISAEDMKYFPIEGFGAYTFDGGRNEGYTISNLTTPLFGSTAATIQNVELTNVNITVTDLAKSGAIVCELYDGQLLNCKATGKMTINSTVAPASYSNQYNDLCYGGLAGYVSASTVKTCTNDIDLTLTSFCAADKTIKATAGGVIGGIADLSHCNGLVNDGKIVYNGTTQKGNTYISGVIGKENTVSGNGAFAELSNCTNNETIETTSTSVCGGSLLLSGITGAAPQCDEVTCNLLKNNGAITHNGESAGLSIAGLISYESTVYALTNCENTKELKVADGATTTSIIIGGLLAGATTAEKVETCKNTGDITLGANAEGGTSAYLGGLASRELVVETITGCSNEGAISIANNAHVTIATVAGLVAGRVSSSSVYGLVVNGSMSNCHNTGNVSIGDGISMTGIAAIAGVSINLTASTSTPTVTNCTNKGTITVGTITNETGTGNSDRLLTGGVFHGVYAGTISECYNYAEGITTVGTAAWTARYMIGGLFGYIGQTGAITDQVITITDCQNFAAVNVAPTGTIGSAQIGGSTSEAYAAATDPISSVVLTRVNNSGAITVSGSYSSGGFPRIGGLLGISNMPPLELKECVNSGTITLATTGTGQKKVGGLVGCDTNKGAFKITSCENKGNINITTVVASLRAGGILASNDNASPVTITGTTNTGNITLSAEQTATGNSYAIGGIIGYNDQENLTISNCTNGAISNTGVIDTTKGAITLGKAPGGSGVAGIAGYLALAQEITSCINYGTIKQQGDSATPRLGGIVGYHTTGNLTIGSCENHGAIVNEGIVSTALHLGGLVGSYAPAATLTVTGSKNTGSVICAGVQTVSVAEYRFGVGGIVGYTAGNTNTISNCTNGFISDENVIDDTKGVVTIGQAISGLGLGGIVGCSTTAIGIATCKNYGHVSQTGQGGNSKAIRAHIAGILGVGSAGNVTITSCENYGLVEYGTATIKHRVDVAGITATTIDAGTNTISGCKNGGTIKFGASSNQEICVAGIVGCPQGTTIVENCENLATAVIWGAGTCSTAFDIAGIGGGPSGATTQFISCINRGLIKQTQTSGGNTNVGGIVGYGYSFGKMEKCENYGQLEIAGSTGAVYAGGLVGYLRQTTKSANTEIRNCVNRANLTFAGSAGSNYAGGGAFGLATTDASPKAELIIENVHNLGNLTYNCTYKTHYFGGIVGFLQRTTNISSCQCWCYVNPDAVDKFGWISGTARSDTATVSNCQIGGGQEAFSEETEEMVSETLIKAGNFHEYIYLNRDNTEVDGCSALTSKPTIDVQTEAAN